MEYCSKEGGQNPYQAGEWPASQEKKGDNAKERLLAIMALATAGDWVKLEAEYPQEWFYQQRNIMNMRGHALKNETQLDGVLQNVWIFGKSGEGKGMLVDKLSAKPYVKDGNNKWWCGYNGEEDVLLDDVNGKVMEIIGQFKHWTDRRNFRAEIKCTPSLWTIRPKRVFVTSHLHPKFYITDLDELAAVLRRFQLVYMVDHIPHYLPRVNVEKPILGESVYLDRDPFMS